MGISNFAITINGSLGRIINVRQARLINRIGAVTLLPALAIVANLSTAQAQSYKGESYGANIGINATLVGVGATIVQNPSLPSTGSGSSLTNQLLNANVQANTNNPLAPLFTVLGANAINTSTIGTGGVATSVSETTALNLFPNLSLNVIGLGGLNLGSLVQADVIRSTTTANVSTNSGHTEITNLRFGVVSLGNFDVSNAVSTTYYLNLLGNVSLTASANVLVPDVAQLVINGQSLSDGGKTRTTDAIAVKVLQGNALAQGQVVVASSTAGFAVVPETNTLALAATGALPLLGIALRRRRRTTGAIEMAA